MSHYTMLYKYGMRIRNFCRRYNFILVFYILRAFLIKNYFTRACWTWEMNTANSTTRLIGWLSTNSYPTRVRGITVKYSYRVTIGNHYSEVKKKLANHNANFETQKNLQREIWQPNAVKSAGKHDGKTRKAVTYGKGREKQLLTQLCDTELKTWALGFDLDPTKKMGNR